MTLIVIVGYLVLVTAVGSAFARRVSSSGQWAAAGSGMGTLMVAAGIAGTRIGGAGTYGVAERAVSGGLWYMWWYAINTFLALAIVGIFFAWAYRRMELHTVGELFKHRFASRRCQWITSLCVQTEYAIVNLIEAYLIGAILAQLTGIPMWLGVLCAAGILVTYVSLGGLWGSAIANLIHCGAILVGLLAVGLLGMRELGGFAEVTRAVEGHLREAGVDSGTWWSALGGGWPAVIGMFFAAAIHTPAASVYTNFSTAARSARMLIPAFLLAGVVASLMPLLAGFVGLVTAAQYGVDSGLRGYNNLTRFAMDLSPLVGGVALAAVLAAVISSGGPILLSSSTMFVNDWLSGRERLSQSALLRNYRITTLVYGLLAAAAAWAVSLTSISLLDLLLFGYAMVVPPAIAVAYLLYRPSVTEPACYWGMLGGYAAGLLWFAAIKGALAAGVTAEAPTLAGRVVYQLFAVDGQGIDPSYATTLVPLVLIPLVSRWTRAEDRNRAAFYAKLSGVELQRASAGPEAA